MPLRDIVRLGHPALRTPARSVGESGLGREDLHRLVSDMVETMRAAGGVGLAAPQVGIDLQLFVWEPFDGNGDGGAAEGATARAILDPMIEAEPGELVYDWEGCLSIPDLRGLVPRHPAVRVHGRDPDGTALDFSVEGYEARIVQHEFDHLNGIVFLDRMRDLRSLAFGREWEEYLTRDGDEGASVG